MNERKGWCSVMELLVGPCQDREALIKLQGDGTVFGRHASQLGEWDKPTPPASEDGVFNCSDQLRLTVEL